jgi:chitin disaccharide deacetylase
LDDFGVSRAANSAITELVAAGNFIKNVSCMAVGPHIEEGAELIKSYKHICLGLHATLNAEWDFIKWPPISPVDDIPTLVTEDGVFYSDPTHFVENPPDIGQILREYDRQLDLLANLGLDISYVDSHMLPERCVDGLSEAMSDWARRKGLIDHIHFYRFPAKLEAAASNSLDERYNNAVAWLESLQEGGYIFIMHPAKYSRELLLYGNRHFPPHIVAAARDVEYRLLRSKNLELVCNGLGINTIRYDEAVLNPELFHKGEKNE